MVMLSSEPHTTRPQNHRDLARSGGAVPDATDATIVGELEAAAITEMRLDFAVERLRRSAPEASAANGLVRWQAVAVFVLIAAVGGALLLDARLTIALVFLLAAVPAMAYLALRMAAVVDVSAGSVAAAPSVTTVADALPHYSVLVPLYREAPVVTQLLTAIDDLQYPRDRLEVLLIVEAVDADTLQAIARHDLPPHIRLVVVPDGAPRTKPRALNFALTHARGTFVVVFDAEDQPEPDQLVKAVAAFRDAGNNVGCLQARLNTYNPASSWFTRQFTLEYTSLFDGILPALERHGLPVMLGGTSNHFPRAVLDDVLAWDPYNVTEDADLGMRLARCGYHVGMLASTTWEEAPPTYAIWLGQRTRWLKGWLQTYLVHMRRPRRLMRELGARRFVAFNLLTGGAVLSALVHPWIYVAVISDVATGHWAAAADGLAGRVLWWAAGFNLVASYAAAILLAVVATRARGRRWLGRSSVWLPVYWLAISWAAYRALAELVRAPHHWEKTTHAGAPAGAPDDRHST